MCRGSRPSVGSACGVAAAAQRRRRRSLHGRRRDRGRDGRGQASAQVLATELDPTAARCARRNHVEVFEGSLDEPLPAVLEHTVDVMTAVVPYVPTDALRLLPRDVQAFEPRLALDGGADGTDLLVEVVRQSSTVADVPAAGSCWNSEATKPNRSDDRSRSTASRTST